MRDLILLTANEKVKRIVIYGAGFYGKTLLKCLYFNNVFKKCIFVESEARNDEVLGWPCVSINQYTRLEGDILIIAVKKSNEKDIVDILNKNNISFDFILNDYHREQISSLAINIKNETNLRVQWLEEVIDQNRVGNEKIDSLFDYSIDQNRVINEKIDSLFDYSINQNRVINEKIDSLFDYIYECREVYNKTTYEINAKIGNIQYLNEVNATWNKQKWREVNTFSNKIEKQLRYLTDKLEQEEVIISILVPVYNTEIYLEKCLKSLKNQSFSDFEVIIINDGSTDNSIDIINKFILSDNRFRIINKTNSGYGHSMNMGIEVAKGKYIAILESDDWADEDMIANLLYCARVNNAEVVLGNYYVYDNNDNQISFEEDLEELNYWERLNKESRANLCYGTPAIWRGLYRKSFLDENNIRFLESPGASYQDVDFFFKIVICSTKLFCIPEGLVYYRVGHSSSSIQNKQKIYCICDEFEEIRGFIKKNNLEDWRYVCAIALFKRYMWNYERLEGTNQKEFLKRFRKDLLILEENGELQKEYWEDNLWHEMIKVKENKDI